MEGEREETEAKAVEPPKEDAPLSKILLIVNLMQIVFTGLQVFTKDLIMYRNVTNLEMVFFRSLFNLIASTIVIKHAKVSFFADIKRELRSALFLRCAVGTLSFLTFSLAVKYIPIGIFFIILNSSPFVVAILAYFWTGDRILPLEVVALFGAFGGIICLALAKPSETVQLESMSDFEQTYSYQIGIALAIITSLTFSVVSVASRKLKSLHYGVIQFVYALMSTICTGIVLLGFCVAEGEMPYVYESWWIYLEVLISSALGMLGQSLMTYSNQHANPSTVALISYMGVSYTFLVDLTIFNSTFTYLQLIGVAITLSFSVAAAIYKIRIQKKDKAAEGKDLLQSSVKITPERK